MIYAALLRGINVGGNKTIAMAGLREMIVAIGLQNPRTLLQSGNLVFETKAQPAAKLEKMLERATAEKLKVECSYLVRTKDEWARIVAANPYAAMAKDDPSHLAVTFCREVPGTGALETLGGEIRGEEQLTAVGRELFVCYPHGMGESKLAIALSKNKLGTICTARNWNTVLKIGMAME